MFKKFWTKCKNKLFQSPDGLYLIFILCGTFPIIYCKNSLQRKILKIVYSSFIIIAFVLLSLSLLAESESESEESFDLSLLKLITTVMIFLRLGLQTFTLILDSIILLLNEQQVNMVSTKRLLTPRYHNYLLICNNNVSLH